MQGLFAHGQFIPLIAKVAYLIVYYILAFPDVIETAKSHIYVTLCAVEGGCCTIKEQIAVIVFKLTHRHLTISSILAQIAVRILHYFLEYSAVDVTLYHVSRVTLLHIQHNAAHILRNRCWLIVKTAFCLQLAITLKRE